MNNPRKYLPRVAVALSSLSILAGLVVIAGWQFRIPMLKGAAFGTFVAPTTALCFLLCGTSILLQLSGGRWRPYLGVVIGVFVAMFAAATLSEYLFHLDLGIDRLFMANRLADWYLPLPGRFALNTAAGFFAAGASLVLLRDTRHRFLTQCFALIVLLIAYLGLVAYMYGTPTLYNGVMAFHTIVLFAILGCALLSAPPDPVIAGALFSPFTGAVASRKMILAIILLLPAFGAIQLWAEQSQLVTVRFGIAVSVVASVVVFTFLALWTAASLNEADRKRVEIEAALLRSGQIAAAGRMAATIAHEINNPLESITNIVFLLKTDALPPEVRRKYVDAAEGELVRVAAIARRTLGFYRDEAKPSECEVSKLLDGVLDVYRRKLEGRVEVRRSYGEDRYILAKAGEVRQVISNLISNAIDAIGREPGQLNLSVSGNANTVSIEIADNGSGIHQANLEKIFDPFFTTKKETGTGLGLWVSRELVARNGGTISVTSSTDPDTHGTMFRLSFPAAVRAQSAELAVRTEPERAESTSQS